VPDWYPLVRAARYLGVSPWELAGQPTTWRHIALASERAEVRARESHTPRR
jgi:hypothetical protein